MPLTPVLLGLGSNFDRISHLQAGLQALDLLLQGIRCSPVFESEAVGIKSGSFYNLVVAAQTDLPLAQLDRQLKAIEAENGRYAPQRKGLPLDIDILVYGDRVGVFDGLLLPREEILRNSFVLWPLSLLEPALEHPGEGRTFDALWRTAQIDQQLWPVSFVWRDKELTPLELQQRFPAPANAKTPD
jgi:2-amino-4-hydroxy-6-hydroxymethyldihydropteridine diphosphokinase